jgi:hypothetical protein
MARSRAGRARADPVDCAVSRSEASSGSRA